MKLGFLFTHPHRLDPDFRPALGQTYKGGPHARCIVTRLTSTSVFYQHADADGRPCGGKWVVDRSRLNNFLEGR